MASSMPFTLGGRIVAASGVLFLVATFLPWHRTCVGVLDAEVCQVDNGWDTAFSGLAALLVLALLAELVVVQVLRIRVPEPGGLDQARLRLAASGVSVALVLLQLLVGDGNLNRSYGAVAGLLLALVLTYGNYLRRGESAPAGRSGRVHH